MDDLFRLYCALVWLAMFLVAAAGVAIVGGR